MPPQCISLALLRRPSKVYHKPRKDNEAKQDTVSTYIAYPPDKSTKNAILIITDVIGHQFINTQLIADKFAAKGYFVLMPDMFNGDSVPLNRPEGLNIMDWVKNHSPVQTEPIIDSVLKEMRENLGCKRIGGVGYCFGGKYVCRYLKPGLLDVGYIAHPTMLEGEELREIEGPLSIAAAGEFFFVEWIILARDTDADDFFKFGILSLLQPSAMRARRSWTNWMSLIRSICFRR